MKLLRVRHLILLLLVASVKADYVDYAISNSIQLKALREMTNQSSADTLNLPANASSIRENITDTFSCENRTYGYYADVDNDCQVFHVCLPSQTPSGRNVTYRWSFICPNETIFNQEVLTCTRPADSIDCDMSPMFYHVNDEMGKVPNKTEEATEKKEKRTPQKWKNERRRENIVMENMLNNVHDEKAKLQTMDIENGAKNEDDRPMLIEALIESAESELEDLDIEQKREEDFDRMIMERNMRDARQMRRGSFRFKNDV